MMKEDSRRQAGKDSRILPPVEHPHNLWESEPNLRNWVCDAELIRLVLRATESLDEPSGPGNSRPHILTGRARTLLTLLVYAYSVSVCAADEIEARLRSDSSFRYLSAGLRLTGDEIRLFRRRHRALVEKVLARTFELASQAIQTDLVGLAAASALFAENRIDESVFLDSVALDF
jgi:hypothetical protein